MAGQQGLHRPGYTEPNERRLLTRNLLICNVRPPKLAERVPHLPKEPGHERLVVATLTQNWPIPV